MPNYVCSRRCPHRANASSTQSYCLAKDPHPTLSLERAKNYLVRRHAELYLFAPASSPSAPRKQHPILLSCKRPTPNPLPAVANTHWRGLRIVWRDAMPNYVCSCSIIVDVSFHGMSALSFTPNSKECQLCPRTFVSSLSGLYTWRRRMGIRFELAGRFNMPINSLRPRLHNR